MKSVYDVFNPKGVLLLAVVLFGWNIWGYDLWAPDEPYFGEGAREMVADGKWVVPHVNGEVTTDKPPLFFWLIALFSLPLDSVTSITARLPSVLAALGSILLIVRLGRRMAGPRTATLAGVMLVTTHMFWAKARWAQIDSLLCFLILVALSAFESFRRGKTPGSGAGLLFWGAAGLAVLAKGPVGLLVPLGIALATLALDRRLREWGHFAPFSGPLVFIAITGAWVTASIVWGGDYSVWAALRQHFVDRAIHGMHHVQPPWYYLQVVPYALFPWSFLLPGALLLAWRRRREADDRFLLVASLFVVVFFTVPTEKRDLYILPAVPFFALMNARLVAAVLGWWEPESGATGKVPGPRWVTWPQGLVGAVLILVACALPFVAPRFGDELVLAAWGLGAVMLAGGLAVVTATIRGRPFQAVTHTALAMAAMLLVVVSFVYPALNPKKSGRDLAYEVRDATAESRAAGRPVLGFDLGNLPRPVNFYSPGVYLKEIPTAEQLQAELAAGETTYMVANEKALPTFPDDLRERMSVLYSTRLSRRDVVVVRVDPAEKREPSPP